MCVCVCYVIHSQNVYIYSVILEHEIEKTQKLITYNYGYQYHGCKLAYTKKEEEKRLKKREANQVH